MSEDRRSDFVALVRAGRSRAWAQMWVGWTPLELDRQMSRAGFARRVAKAEAAVVEDFHSRIWAKARGA